ncbi:MAG TPA: zinc ABC transporter substrate-binding protein [Thermoanaerobaculia bacterium]|nr:zinc ABC transporter substrate-binding protein [Thermoanaerobaculia bacterium]
MSIASILTAALALTTVGAPHQDARLRVVVSLPPQVWLVESIGGPRVEVAALVGPGESEETYSPTDAQVSAALRASVFFRIGASFEQAPWFRALDAAERLEIADTRDGVDLITMDGSGPYTERGTSGPTLDPHLWTSPRRLAIQARTVAATLTRLDPSGRGLYERRLGEVTRELEALDRELAGMLESYRGRAFFVFHPTWGYLATDYGLRQIAVETEGKEPTDRDLTRLLELARVERPRVLLVEPQVPSNVAEAVAGAIGATVVRHDSLAADPPANLRSVARSLVEAFAP